jgi:hypothetical protein
MPFNVQSLHDHPGYIDATECDSVSIDFRINKNDN